MHKQGLDDGARVVVLELGLESGIVGGWIHEAVEEFLVADFAEQDLHVVLGEAGSERAVVNGLKECGRDEGVVRAGAEGV